MPKVKWCKVAPKINYLRPLFDAYRRANKITTADMAKVLGCSQQNVAQQISRDTDLWTIGQLKKYSAAAGVTLEEAVRAAAGIPTWQSN